MRRDLARALQNAWDDDAVLAVAEALLAGQLGAENRLSIDRLGAVAEIVRAAQDRLIELERLAARG